MITMSIQFGTDTINARMMSMHDKCTHCIDIMEKSVNLYEQGLQDLAKLEDKALADHIYVAHYEEMTAPCISTLN